MPTDVVELESYFKDVEQLFPNFEVANDLTAQLLRPYLNKKAKTLVARMNTTHSTDYEAVKCILLQQFKHSPKIYLERFNNKLKKSEETYTLFSSRLKSLLEYYLTSRKVDEDYDKLTELLVCDRVKDSLPEGCLNTYWLLRQTQSDGWLKIHDLASAIDLYFANRWRDGDKQRAGAIGLPASTKFSGTSIPGNARNFQ